jgi:hypothetical protein
MARDKIYIAIIGALVFIVYILIAAQPIPSETILFNNWLKPLESRFAVEGEEETAEEAPKATGYVLPFALGNHFGYVDGSGNLLLNKIREKNISLSPDYWAEYDPAPELIEIRSPPDNELITIENAGGYPLFLDGRIFLISKDQTSLDEIDKTGAALWSYDFEAPLTSIDAANGYVFAGTLDGVVELLDSGGGQIFPSYAPGASRIAVILSCRISSDGSKLAIISGIDKQRFLFLERYGKNDYRITHHEYLQSGDGFRREVYLDFIDNDSSVVFEREEGLGIFDVKSRTTVVLPLPGRLEAVDESGEGGLFFIITGNPRGAAERGPAGGRAEQKRFLAIRLPNSVLLDAPFKSDTSFLARRGRELVVGGGMTLGSFKLDKR